MIRLEFLTKMTGRDHVCREQEKKIIGAFPATAGNELQEVSRVRIEHTVMRKTGGPVNPSNRTTGTREAREPRTGNREPKSREPSKLGGPRNRGPTEET